ncbi:MAG: hypothetical protein K9H64_04350 [Bacteroidales bacterium]|nr:hypothetical protein [Bacteroidales bacterium]MCF8455001.1 hypothetical protein [Bacteroidales bacterium]
MQETSKMNKSLLNRKKKCSEIQYRLTLQQKLKKESALVSQESMIVLKEFEKIDNSD